MDQGSQTLGKKLCAGDIGKTGGAVVYKSTRITLIILAIFAWVRCGSVQEDKEPESVDVFDGDMALVDAWSDVALVDVQPDRPDAGVDVDDAGGVCGQALVDRYQELVGNRVCASDEACQTLLGRCDLGLGSCYVSVNYTIAQDDLDEIGWEYNRACLLGDGDCFCQGAPPSHCEDGLCRFVPCLERSSEQCVASQISEENCSRQQGASVDLERQCFRENQFAFCTVSPPGLNNGAVSYAQDPSGVCWRFLYVVSKLPEGWQGPFLSSGTETCPPSNASQLPQCAP